MTPSRECARFPHRNRGVEPILAAELVLSQGAAHEGSLVLLGIRAALAKAEGK